MAIQVKIKNQAETETKVTLDKNTPHIQLQTRQKYVPENIAIELEGADQSDATATADKIINGYTAYVDEGKITGTCTSYIKEVESVPASKETDIIHNTTNNIYYVWKES